ncbi:hypothetical protein [Foetidibacter luteolus]|uniref:hypothetical protein n=1 Tax=Foetidibacter luteolus TaxID=2608880 RepID=UPI00129AD19D|nr:hypothetical protein [Foetidibacter luteolus]
MKTAEYTTTPKDDGYTFYVTPAPKVIGGCAGIFFILLLAFLGALILSAVSSILSVIAFIGIAAWCFLKMDMRKKNHRHPSSFSVYPGYIEVNGQKLVRENIHRVIIKNAYDKTPRLHLTGQTVPTGVGIGHDIRNMLEQISYSVDVEAGGKATQLAGGMDDVTANGLLTEVNQILGFR